MAFEWIRISLRIWKADAIVGQDPFELLHVKPEGDLRTREGATVGEASLVYFVDEQVPEADSEDSEPSEVFADAVSQGLLAAARWIESRPEGAFDRCRAAGLEFDVFIGGWIDQDQMDLSLPAAFLRACGNAGLSISIVTND